MPTAEAISRVVVAAKPLSQNRSAAVSNNRSVVVRPVGVASILR